MSTPSIPPSLASTPNTCTVCNIPIGHANHSNITEDLVKLPCSHSFGDKCIDACLRDQEQGHCPTCHADCPKDFVDTWSLLRETVSAAESLGAHVEETTGNVRDFGEGVGGSGEAAIIEQQIEVAEPETATVGDETEETISTIDEGAIIEGRVDSLEEAEVLDAEQPIFHDETDEIMGSIDGRIEASAAELFHAEPPAIDNNNVEAIVEDQMEVSEEAETTENPEAIIEGLEDVVETDVVEKTEEIIESPKEIIEGLENAKEADVVDKTGETKVEEPESVENTSAEIETIAEEIEGLENIEEASVEEEALVNEVEEIEGTGNIEDVATKEEVLASQPRELEAAEITEERVKEDDAITNEFAGETEETIDGLGDGVQDFAEEESIDGNAVDEDVTLVEDTNGVEDVKDYAIEDNTAKENAVEEVVENVEVKEIAIEEEAAEEVTIEEAAIEEAAIEEAAIEEAAIEEEAAEEGAIEHGAIEHEAIEHEAIEHEAIEHEAVEHEAVEEGAVEEETVEEETVEVQDVENEDAGNEDVENEAFEEEAVQDEVAEENAAEEVAGEDIEGPTDTAQEVDVIEVQAAMTNHFFRTEGYNDQYRTKIEDSRNAAGRSIRNMVSTFNIKTHPLPEGRERALVSKNTQVWAKYLHSLKLQSLNELKSNRGRSFLIDIARFYQKARGDFFEQVDKNLAAADLDGPDVDAVKVTEDLLKASDAEEMAELESILASLGEPLA